MFPTWAVISGPSPINWCEPDFVNTSLSFRFAEFHNTITNLAYIVAACLLLVRWRKSSLSLSTEGVLFGGYIVSLFLTGVFSWVFHSTLTWGAQKGDEIFENSAVIILFHVASFSKHTSVQLIRNTFLHVISVSFCIWIIPMLFCELHLILVSIFTVYAFAQMELLREVKKRVAIAAMCAIIGFACWLLDFFFCSYFGEFLLHAYGWHILTAISLYQSGLIIYICLRDRHANANPHKNHSQ